MVNTKDTSFTPIEALPPGITIKENMKYLGMTQNGLAKRLEITEKHLSDILTGKSPLTHETSIKLESVIGPSAKFWMNLEANYQINKSRLEKVIIWEKRILKNALKNDF